LAPPWPPARSLRLGERDSVLIASSGIISSMMKSSTFANNWVTENNRISLVVENKAEEIRVRPHPLGISWCLFVPPLAMTCVLFMPQAREYFLSAGWRWAHVMLLSFGISFSLNPLFLIVVYNFNYEFICAGG